MFPIITEMIQANPFTTIPLPCERYKTLKFNATATRNQTNIFGLAGCKTSDSFYEKHMDDSFEFFWGAALACFILGAYQLAGMAYEIYVESSGQIPAKPEEKKEVKKEIKTGDKKEVPKDDQKDVKKDNKKDNKKDVKKDITQDVKKDDKKDAKKDDKKDAKKEDKKDIKKDIKKEEKKDEKKEVKNEPAYVLSISSS
jgi:hypothetical protein